MQKRGNPESTLKGLSLRRRWVVALVACLVILADQTSKSLAEANLANHSIELLGPVQLRLVYNSGAAFSIGTGLGPVIEIVAAVVVVFVWLYLKRVEATIALVAGGLIIGGAISNVSDRIFRANHGAVIDFFYTKYWPTFNVADACITTGIILLAWHSLRARKVT